MKPDEILARRIAAEVEVELDALDRLADELGGAPRSADTWSLRARGSILHDFYTGVERILIRIAEELNGGVPKGEQWRRQLLADMMVAIPGVRPALIGVDLARELGDYLRFRHVFRNVYGSVLEEDRMQPLENRLPEVCASVVREVRAFLAWMVGE